MNRWRYVLISLTLLLASIPVRGYTVLLKDGTQIITREEYRREGERVYLVLMNGAETFIAAAELDFAKTDELNKSGAGNARVLTDQSDAVVVDEEPQTYQPETLRQLAGRTNLALPEIGVRREVEKEVPLTTAGFVDLWQLERSPHPDVPLVEELARHLDSLAAVDYEIFQGSSENRVLLAMVTHSEPAIFASLRAAASALMQAQSRFPDEIAELELVMSATSGSGSQRAGQFVLTRELAGELLSGAIDPPMFFYRHVQF